MSSWAHRRKLRTIESLAYGFSATFSHFRHLVLFSLAQDLKITRGFCFSMGSRPYVCLSSCFGLLALFGSSSLLGAQVGFRALFYFPCLFRICPLL